MTTNEILLREFLYTESPTILSGYLTIVSDDSVSQRAKLFLENRDGSKRVELPANREYLCWLKELQDQNKRWKESNYDAPLDYFDIMFTKDSWFTSGSYGAIVLAMMKISQ